MSDELDVPALRFATREEWLLAAIAALRPRFAEIGAELPRVIRISVGFNIGSAAENNVTGGVTYKQACAADGANAVFISPEQGDPIRVLSILMHELIHVSDDCESGHRGDFARRFAALGMTGKRTFCSPGPTLEAELILLAGALGEYPHGAMHVTGRKVTPLVPAGPDGPASDEPASSGPKKQGNRSITLRCPDCGNTCRSTRKWIDLDRTPICPCTMTTMEEAS